jgi:hypothetical protein
MQSAVVEPLNHAAAQQARAKLMPVTAFGASERSATHPAARSVMARTASAALRAVPLPAGPGAAAPPATPPAGTRAGPLAGPLSPATIGSSV